MNSVAKKLMLGPISEETFTIPIATDKTVVAVHFTVNRDIRTGAGTVVSLYCDEVVCSTSYKTDIELSDAIKLHLRMATRLYRKTMTPRPESRPLTFEERGLLI